MKSKPSKPWVVRQAVTSMLFVILVLPPPLAAVEGKQPAAGEQWKVEYLAGPIQISRGRKKQLRPLDVGHRLKVTVDKQQIVCRGGKSVTLSVPVADVTEVSYEATVHRRSKQVLGGLGSMSGGGCYPPEGCGAMVVGILVAAAVSAPFKYTQHFVQITWQEDGKGKQLLFKVGKGDYATFLAELRNATGKEWKNLSSERDKRQKALRSAGAESLTR